MVVPLLTRLLAPSPRDECEFDREVPPDLLPFERPRRDELELAEDGREIWEGGARVAPDEVVWVALGLEDGSGDDMLCAESSVLGRWIRLAWVCQLMFGTMECIPSRRRGRGSGA